MFKFTMPSQVKSYINISHTNESSLKKKWDKVHKEIFLETGQGISLIFLSYVAFCELFC